MFAGLALALAALGVYGVTAYAAILGMILREAMAVAAAGAGRTIRV